MAELLLSGGWNGFFDKIFDENLKDRKIIINNEIDQDLIETAVLQIMKFNKEDKDIPVEKRKPIFIYVNSLGGEVPNGFCLIDAIETSKTPVYGVVFGYAYSMGALILLATHKRFAFKNSTVLIHDGTQGAITTGSKFKDIAKFYDEMDTRIKDFVLKNTDIDSDFYDAKYQSEFYFYSDKGKELGVIDHIIGVDVDLDEIL